MIVVANKSVKGHKLACLFLFVCGFYFTTLFAQNQGAVNYRDELPSSETFDVDQDSLGFIWIGTDRGLVRYDGQIFTTIKGFNQAVTEIEFAPDGRLWLATANNKLHYLQGDSVLPCEFNKEISALRFSIRDFWIDSEGVFFLSGSQYYLLIQDREMKKITEQDTRFVHINTHFKERPLIYGRNEMSQNGKFQFRWNEKTLDEITDIRSSKGRFSSAWGASRAVVYCSYEKRIFRIEQFGVTSSKYLNANILTIVGLVDGSLVVATEGAGLQFLDPKDFSLRRTLYPGYSCSSSFIDADGSLWTTTLEGGVFYLPMHRLNASFLLPGEAISDLKQHQGGLLVATKNKLHFLSEAEPKPNLRLLFDDHGEIEEVLSMDSFAISVGGQTVMSGAGKMEVLSHSFSKTVDASAQSLLLGSRLRIKKLDFATRALTAQSIFDALQVTDLEVCGEDVFVASTNGWFQVAISTLKTKRAGLPGMPIASIKALISGSDTVLVVGTLGHGLLIQQGDSIRSIDQESGLCSDFVNDIALIGDSCIWVSTSEGLSKIKTDELLNKNIPVENFTKANALIGKEVTVSCQLGDNLYVGTIQGLNVIPIGDARQKYSEKPVLSSEIIIDGAAQKLVDTLFFSPENVALEISFRTPVFNLEGEILYEYMLKGFTEQWNKNATGTVQFIGLSPGNYDLTVRYKKEDGQWSSSNQILHIQVLPRFYQTIWFWSICVLVTVLVILLVFRISLNRQRVKGELQQRLHKFQYQALTSQMNPHFIFNSMNSINNYLLQNDKEKSSKYLSEFARLMRSTLDNSRHDVIPLEGIVSSLERYIKLEQLRLKSRLEYRLVVDPAVDLKRTLLPPMLLQPFVENSIWHGIAPKKEGGKISIAITQKDSELSIVISDNGIGREKSLELGAAIKKSDSQGLMITQKRFELMSSLYGETIRYWIKDLKEPSGTEVTVKVPLKYD